MSSEGKIRVNTNKDIPTIEWEALKNYERNAIKDATRDVEKLKVRILSQGFTIPLFVWPKGKYLVDGAGRFKALSELEDEGYTIPDLPFIPIQAKDKKEAKQRVLDVNSQYGDITMDTFKLFVDDLDIATLGDINLPAIDFAIAPQKVEVSNKGTKSNLAERYKDGVKGMLAKKFLVPPFTILDTRQGFWKERKAEWMKLIGDNGESRELALAKSDNVMAGINNGVSILDPVLAELVVKWFGIEGGKAFDPFAGDTVFGFVSASVGQAFTGIELRDEQVELNNERTASIEQCAYICDDGLNVGEHIKTGSQDLLFSCPPYYDLEVYSDSEQDVSNMGTYQEYLDTITKVFARSIKCLKDNRFAVIVVGDVRDKTGLYRGLPYHIKEIFESRGMPLYNEAVLVEPLGTLPLRVQQWMRNRKLGKCHQNV